MLDSRHFSVDNWLPYHEEFPYPYSICFSCLDPSLKLLCDSKDCLNNP